LPASTPSPPSPPPRCPSARPTPASSKPATSCSTPSAQTDFAHWGALYVRWEAGLLEELGFGLDLTRCAATGAVDNLIFVSPRTGRAVSAAAGAAYKERLFALPGFLLGSQNATPDAADVAAGLKLTGHFLLERVLHAHGKDMPPARLRLDSLAASESG